MSFADSGYFNQIPESLFPLWYDRVIEFLFVWFHQTLKFDTILHASTQGNFILTKWRRRYEECLNYRKGSWPEFNDFATHFVHRFENFLSVYCVFKLNLYWEIFQNHILDCFYFQFCKNCKFDLKKPYRDTSWS